MDGFPTHLGAGGGVAGGDGRDGGEEAAGGAY